VHDVNILDEILPEVGAFYVMDHGYVDFERLYVFTDQGILRHKRERGEDANLDRGLGLRAGGHRPQETGPGGEPLPNSTDSERDAFRENAHFTGLHPPGSQNDLLDSANQLNLFEL
jgi:hypothetical protein